MALCDIVMDWRSLALRDEAMAPCDDMLLWKLAPINDIQCGVHKLQFCHAHAVCCSLAAVSPLRAKDTKLQANGWRFVTRNTGRVAF